MYMKISVIIPAHNEAATIARLLHAVHSQSLTPYEVIVIAHNCTDTTAGIAGDFPNTKVITLNGPEGVVYARQEGFDHASGDFLVSIDADSYPLSKQWLSRLTHPFTQDPNLVATGGPVIFYNHLIGLLLSLNFFWLKKLISPSHIVYFWGANYCVKAETFKEVGGFKYLISHKSKLDLTTWSDDYYLYKLVSHYGTVKIIDSAIVATLGPRLTTQQWLHRARINGIDKRILDNELG
ncbi:MAG: glycosyltransferase family 2 protein [Patescibacteria group bacterium]